MWQDLPLGKQVAGEERLEIPNAPQPDSGDPWLQSQGPYTVCPTSSESTALPEISGRDIAKGPGVCKLGPQLGKLGPQRAPKKRRKFLE